MGSPSPAQIKFPNFSFLLHLAIFKFRMRTGNWKFKSGFTLVELLITIAIISILSSAVAFSTRINQDRARDSVRKSDLAVLYNALNAYLIDKGSYPPPLELDSGTEFASDSPNPWIPGLTQDYLKTIPKDPRQSKLQNLLALFKKIQTQIFLKKDQAGRVASSTNTTFIKTVDFTVWSEAGRSVIQSSDGGYMLVGESYNGTSKYDLIIAKYDNSGKVSWAKTIGGNNNEGAASVIQTSSNSYLIGGWTDSYGSGKRDMMLVSLDDGGNIAWSKTFGGSENEYVNSMAKTSDEGFILVGPSTSYNPVNFDKGDTLLVKVDSRGNTQWSKTIDAYLSPYSTTQTRNGDYVIVGAQSEFNNSTGTWGPSGFFIVKINGQGDLIWYKSAAGFQGLSVIEDSDGNYIVGANGNTQNHNSGALLAKFNSSGDLIWLRELTPNGAGNINSIKETQSGNYIMTGMNTEYAWEQGIGSYLILMEFDKNGNNLCLNPVGTPSALCLFTAFCNTSFRLFAFAKTVSNLALCEYNQTISYISLG